MTKYLFLAALLISGNALAANAFGAAEDRCPALAGEFVAGACPKADTAFYTTMIHQIGCKAIGFQRVNYKPDRTVLNWAAVNWEPVGLGKMLRAESDKIATYIERFYDADSIYAYITDLDKVTKESTYKGVEIIDLLPNGNLFVSYGSSGMGQTMIRWSQCTLP